MNMRLAWRNTLIAIAFGFPLYISAQIRLYRYIAAPPEFYKNDSLINFSTDASDPFTLNRKFWDGRYDNYPYDLELSEPASNGIPYRFEIFRNNLHFQINSLRMPIYHLRRDTLLYFNRNSAIYQFRKKRWVIPLQNPNFIGINGKWLIFQDQEWSSVLLNSKSRRKKRIKKRIISSDLDAIVAKSDSIFLEEKDKRTYLGLSSGKVRVHNGYTKGFFQNGKILLDRGMPLACFVLNDTRLYAKLKGGYKLIYQSAEPITVQQFPLRLYPSDGCDELIYHDYVASLLSEGCFVIKKQGKLGLVDTNGIVRMPFVLDSVEGDFQKGLLTVQVAGKWGYMNLKGEMAIPPQYDEALPFYDNLAAVRLGEKWGYINQNAVLIIPCQYVFANPFMYGQATVFIDSTGNRCRIDTSNKPIPEEIVRY